VHADSAFESETAVAMTVAEMQQLPKI